MDRTFLIAQINFSFLEGNLSTKTANFYAEIFEELFIKPQMGCCIDV